MSYKPTLIAVILALIGVLIFWQVSRGDPSTMRSRTSEVPLVSSSQLPIDDVTRVTLTRNGEDTLVFERSGMNWMQVEPFVYPMDRYSMRQLSAVAHQVQVVQSLGPEALGGSLTTESLGLAPPEADIVYEWGEDKSLRLQLGRRGIGGRAYMRMGDQDDVLIVRQGLHERVLEMNPREWRDRTIFQNVGVESDRIVRSDGANRLVLERDRRQWRMVEPVQTRVDETALEQFMQAVGGARSAGYIADNPENLNRFGLDPSGAEFTVVTSRVSEDASQRITDEQVLRIGMPVGAGTQDRYGIVDGRPAVVRLPVAVLQALFLQPTALIAQTGSGAYAPDVRRIRISSDTGEVILERELDRWRALEHGNVDVPEGYVRELLSQLTELQAGNVLVQSYPQELEVAVVTFFGSRGQPLDTVRIVHDPNTDRWALENGDNVLRVFTGGFRPRLTAEDFGLTAILAD